MEPPSRQPDVPPLTLRERQAAHTRREILVAARRLFLEKGYSSTSVVDIASAAGVAVQTIYSGIGSKAELVRALNDHLDTEAGIHEILRQLGTASDLGEALHVATSIPRSYVEGEVGRLVEMTWVAASQEPDLAHLRDEGIRRHREGWRYIISMLSERYPLVSEVTLEDATAIAATLTRAEVWWSFTQDHGWSLDQTQRWLAGTLQRSIFASSS